MKEMIGPGPVEFQQNQPEGGPLPAKTYVRASTVYTFNPLEDPRWAGFVQRHPQASIFHTPAWLEALHRTYGYEPIVYTTSAPGASLTNGIVFCRISSWLTGRRMVSLPFADHCEPLVESPEERKEIVDSLQCALHGENLKYIEIRPLNADLLTEPGMQKSNSFCFHVLDLRPALADLFRALQKDSIQRKIRRAEQEALFYSEGRSEALLHQFYRLFLLTRRRHNLPPQPFNWFRNLVGCLGDRLKIRVASKDGQPIASILTLCHSDTMVYKYGCSDASTHNLGAMPFLLWKAIEDAKEHGNQQFDLGRSDCDNTGLITFKNRWGSTKSVLNYVRISTLRHRPLDSRSPSGLANRLFAGLPDRLLTATGKFLYKHMG